MTIKKQEETELMDKLCKKLDDKITTSLILSVAYASFVVIFSVMLKSVVSEVWKILLAFLPFAILIYATRTPFDQNEKLVKDFLVVSVVELEKHYREWKRVKKTTDFQKFLISLNVVLIFFLSSVGTKFLEDISFIEHEESISKEHLNKIIRNLNLSDTEEEIKNKEAKLNELKERPEESDSKKKKEAKKEIREKEFELKKIKENVVIKYYQDQIGQESLLVKKNSIFDINGNMKISFGFILFKVLALSVIMCLIILVPPLMVILDLKDKISGKNIFVKLRELEIKEERKKSSDKK